MNNQELELSDFSESIQKGFKEYDLQKGVYKNNEENRKLGRVGQSFGGSEDKPEKYKQKVYHGSYGSATDEVEKYAEAEGYTIDLDDLQSAYLDAFFKPKEGKTKRDSFPLVKNDKVSKKQLHAQIFNMGNGKFEFNAYIN
jgi:hypothetical protein